MERVNFIRHKKGSFQLGLYIMLFKEDDNWVIYSPALNLSSYGESKEDTEKAFADAISVYLEYTIKKGTLEKELKKLGWEKKSQKICELPAEKYDRITKTDPYIADLISAKEIHSQRRAYSIPVSV